MDLSCLPQSLVHCLLHHGSMFASALLTGCSRISAPSLQRLVLPDLTTLALLAQHDREWQARCATGRDNEKQINRSRVMRRHAHAAHLLAFVRGCPALQWLELIGWEPPAVALSAVLCTPPRGLRCISTISVSVAVCDEPAQWPRVRVWGIQSDSETVPARCTRADDGVCQVKEQDHWMIPWWLDEP